ncbi:MAG: HEAT repeat domain-containing protein [Planctomycetota bacterium]
MPRQTIWMAACLGFAIFSAALALILFQGGAGPRTSLDAFSSIQVLHGRLDGIEDRLEARLAGLEEEMRLWPQPVAAAGDARLRESGGGGRPEETARVPEAAGDSDGTLAQVLSRLDDLERRVRGLEEDPIQRGFTFLQSQNAELRRQGIRTLGRIARSDPQALAAIRQMLQDPDAETRRVALETLAGVGDKESASLVAGLLADQNPAVRRGAVEALGRLGAASAGADIAWLLKDPDAGVRERAADVLGRLKAKEGAEFLMEALKDPNDEVRGQAIASLGEIGAKEAIPLLRELFAKDPGRQRFRVINALKALGDTEAFREEVRRISAVALGAEDERARREALRTLGWVARDASRDVFRRALEDPSERVREEARRALGQGRRE